MDFWMREGKRRKIKSEAEMERGDFAASVP